MDHFYLRVLIDYRALSKGKYKKTNTHIIAEPTAYLRI